VSCWLNILAFIQFCIDVNVHNVDTAVGQSLKEDKAAEVDGYSLNSAGLSVSRLG
jgi:hypothetical protein